MEDGLPVQTMVCWGWKGMDSLFLDGLCSRYCWFVQGKCNREGTINNQKLGESYKL